MTGQRLSKVRILFLPTVDATNTNAQSLNTREIALRLNPERFDVTLFFQSQPDSRLTDLPHVRLRQLPGRMKTAAILREMFADYDLIAYVDFSPASYLFVHTPRAFRGGAKTVLHVESTDFELTGEARLLSFLHDGVISNCDAYTGITEYVANELKAVVDSRVDHLLPVGVDTSVFSAPTDRNHDVATVLFVGTMVARKYPLEVIRAAKYFPATHFRMVGPDRHGYAEVVKKELALSGAQNVILEGPMSQGELVRAMQESDILLLPSRVEGLPKVTLEASASGLPCIVFCDYKTPSVLDGVTGFQVATREEMIDRLSLLLGDRRLRVTMGSAARQHAQNFEWDKVAAKWEKAYWEIAGRGVLSS